VAATGFQEKPSRQKTGDPRLPAHCPDTRWLFCHRFVPLPSLRPRQQHGNEHAKETPVMSCKTTSLHPKIP